MPVQGGTEMNFREKVLETWQASKLSRYELAKITNIPYPSLCRFLNSDQGKSVAERLIPFVYGEEKNSLFENGIGDAAN